MMDVTVKTLDGQNRSFSVPEDITVRQFKEKIASSINILPEVQRLIFQGRVLHDEKLLKDYDVHGKVVHVVLRPPPTAGNPPAPDNARPNVAPAGREVSSVVVGSFTLPAEVIDANMVQNIAQDAIRSLGDMGRNARVSTRTSPDGSSVDVHIHLGPVQTSSAVSEAQMRLNTARQMMRLATEALNQLENQPPGSRENASSTSYPSSSNTSCPPSTARQEPGEELVSSTSVSQSASSPMDTSEAIGISETDCAPQSSESVRSPQTSADRSTLTGQSSETSSASPPNDGVPSGGQAQAPRGPVRPNIGALGEVMVELHGLSRRLQPYMNRLLQIVQADAEMDQNEQRESQRVCDMVSEAMHAISHAYHALSDLTVDLSQNQPRQLFVTLAIAQQHTAVIQHAVPIQAQIQIGGSPHLIRHQFGQNWSSPSTVTPNAVQVPSSTASTTSSVSTGTNTAPQPTAMETGTQPAQASEPGEPHATTSAAAFIISEDEMQRISQQMSQQMSAGLQNMFAQGLQQGDGTTENPYVFVEMGPDSMTVNSISAEVISTGPDYNPPLTDHPSSTTTQSAGTATQPQFVGSPVTGPGPMPQGAMPPNFMPPPNFMQEVIQQLVRQPGGQPQRMQINIRPGLSQGPLPYMGFPLQRMAAAPMGVRFAPRMMNPFVPHNDNQRQTGSGVTLNSGTQMSATPTSVPGIHTTSSTVPSNTSGTQTSSGTVPSSTSGTPNIAMPHATAFVMPGMPVMDQSINPVDPYLPCSSRHFLSQHARSIGQGNAQNSETAMTEMVSNLMSGLLSGVSGSTAQAPTSSTGVSSTHQPRPRRPAGPPPTSVQIGVVPPQRPATMNAGRMPFIPGLRLRLHPTQPTTLGQGVRPTAHPVAAAAPSAPAVPVIGSTPQGLAGAPIQTSIMQELRNMLQQANQQHTPQGNQANAGSTSTTTGPAAATTNQSEQNANRQSQPLSDEMFTQLVSGITGYMTQAALGQAPRQTITDFLSGMGENYGIPSGEGFINDVFACVLSNLQITDILTIFYGEATPLNQVQRPLKEFLSARVLEGSPPIAENIRSSVERLIEAMQPEILDTVKSCQPRPQIDFLATLNRFFSQQFYNLVTLIINSIDGDQNFGNDLYGCFRRMLSELMMLCCRCLGGMAAVERLVASRLQVLTSGVNPFIQNWMGSMTSRQLSTFIPTITVAESEIAFYITYRQVDQPPLAGAVQTKATLAEVAAATTTVTDVKSGVASVTKCNPSPLREPSQKRASALGNGQGPRPSVQRFETTLPSEEISGHNRIYSPAGDVQRGISAVSTPTVVAENQQSPSNNMAVNGSLPVTEDWQSVVPPEWVPIIAQDIEAQRAQLPQSPHSDAYLQGMPPKRRKLMTRERPCNVANAAEMLPESIRHAMTAAGVEPITSMENIESDLQLDSQLHDAYENQINHTLAQRLEHDTDFEAISERFPGARELFHKNNDSKK